MRIVGIYLTFKAIPIRYIFWKSFHLKIVLLPKFMTFVAYDCFLSIRSISYTLSI